MRDRYNLRPLIGNAEFLRNFDHLMSSSYAGARGAITPLWMADGRSFCYVAERADGSQILFRADGHTGRIEELFDVRRLSASLKSHLGCEPAEPQSIERVVELGPHQYQLTVQDSEYTFSLDTDVITAANPGLQPGVTSHSEPRSAGSQPAVQPARVFKRSIYGAEMLVPEVVSPDGRTFARIDEGNIVLRSCVGGAIALTTDGTPEFSWDIEARRVKVRTGLGLAHHHLEPWSPDGRWLFGVKVDRRVVPERPYIAHLEERDEVRSIRIAHAGGALDIPHPHAIDVRGRRCVPFELGDTRDQFFTLIGWLPQGSEVLFSRHSRDFRTVHVLAGDPTTGRVRTVLSETAETFVALQHDVVFSGDNHAKILDEGSGLIWRSSRTGWNHFYLYGMEGASGRALTQGEFPVIDVLCADEEGGWIYFTAHHDQQRPYDTHLCRVRLTGGTIERLTRLDGVNEVQLSPARRTFLAVNSRPDRPYRSDFYRTDGTHLTTLEPRDAAPPAAVTSVHSEEFTVTAADGKTVLWGVIHRPADLRTDLKYPVIDHIYAGPQIAMVRHDFGRVDEVQAKLDRALASLGYLVVSLDARGTPERSKAFHDVVHGNFGRHEIADHVGALRQLAERHPYFDLDRVGAWGHSWGGYFTIRALVQVPEVFRVGVASAPAIDPHDLFIYEPYLGHPAREKAVYDYANNNLYAEKIAGRLMLVAGTADPIRTRVVMRFARRLIEAGVDHELVMLPDNPHGYCGDRNEDYFVHKLVSYFEVHLKNRGRH